MWIQKQYSAILWEWQQELSSVNGGPRERTWCSDRSGATSHYTRGRERIRHLCRQSGGPHRKVLLRQLIQIDIRNRRPPLKQQVSALGTCVCHRERSVLANLAFDGSVPLLNIWHGIARHAHGKDRQPVKVV